MTTSVLLLNATDNATGDFKASRTKYGPHYVGEYMLAVLGSLGGGSITFDGAIVDKYGKVILGTEAPIKNSAGTTFTISAVGYYYLPVAQLEAIRAVLAGATAPDVQVYIC